MRGLYSDLGNDSILPSDLYHELKDLFSQNRELIYVRELDALGIDVFSDWMVSCSSVTFW